MGLLFGLDSQSHSGIHPKGRVSVTPRAGNRQPSTKPAADHRLSVSLSAFGCVNPIVLPTATEEPAPEAAEAAGEDEADLPAQAREHAALQGGRCIGVHGVRMPRYVAERKQKMVYTVRLTTVNTFFCRRSSSALRSRLKFIKYVCSVLRPAAGDDARNEGSAWVGQPDR